MREVNRLSQERGMIISGYWRWVSVFVFQNLMSFAKLVVKNYSTVQSSFDATEHVFDLAMQMFLESLIFPDVSSFCNNVVNSESFVSAWLF